jgi:hypothetical protein
MLPGFTKDGLLPPGDYPLTIDELRQSILVVGNGIEGWNAAWRLQLVENLSILVRQLWKVVITEIFIDGSFVEMKPIPNDIDGYFVCDRQAILSGSLLRQLQAIDPIWTWAAMSRKPFRQYSKPQLPMWHQYRVELFPHYGQKCGLLDENGNEREFPSAFRHTRHHVAKGIIRLTGES